MELSSMRGEVRNDGRIMFSMLSKELKERALKLKNVVSEYDPKVNWDVFPICFGNPQMTLQEIDDAAAVVLGIY